MGLFSWLTGPAVSEADIRSEIWRLGGRHLGWPLEGALKELAEPGISGDRARLLRACIRQLRLSPA